MYFERDIEKTLGLAAKSFQVITIFGSRQVGKTTTVAKLFGGRFNYVTLDDADELAMALNAPKQFMFLHPWPLIIDEVQKAPNLLSQIKIAVDEQRLSWLDKNEPRQLMFVLTGSNHFELQEGVSESLAGRTAVVNLASMTQMEKMGLHGSLFVPEITELVKKQEQHKINTANREEIFHRIFLGGMPDVVTGVSEWGTYFKAYVDTYIEKDVRKLIKAGKEMQFRSFLTIVALRTGQELNYGSIAGDVGINVETCKRWISILEASGIVILLQPYMANISKRVIKTPKLFFMDTGLCSYLCKFHTSEMLGESYLSGSFFETYVVSEIIKSFYNNNVEPKDFLYYYRDIDRKEIDLLYVDTKGVVPIEIKTGFNPSKPDKNFKVLEKYRMKILPGLVIDTAESIRAINDNVYIIPVGLVGV